MTYLTIIYKGIIKNIYIYINKITKFQFQFIYILFIFHGKSNNNISYFIKGGLNIHPHYINDIGSNIDGRLKNLTYYKKSK